MDVPHDSLVNGDSPNAFNPASSPPQRMTQSDARSVPSNARNNTRFSQSRAYSNGAYPPPVYNPPGLPVNFSMDALAQVVAAATAAAFQHQASDNIPAPSVIVHTDNEASAKYTSFEINGDPKTHCDVLLRASRRKGWCDRPDRSDSHRSRDDSRGRDAHRSRSPHIPRTRDASVSASYRDRRDPSSSDPQQSPNPSERYSSSRSPAPRADF